jgi:alcohol dehydrogenase class IV
MIQSFSLECPGAIHFGMNTRALLPEILSTYGKKVFLLSGTCWFSESGWKKKITSLLKGFHLDVYPCPGGEPTIDSINNAITATREFNPDVIIGIGGGTVLDTAKAVSGLIHAGHPLVDYLEGIGKGIKLEKPGVPWIAMPTTSGTGAEVTKNSVITSREHRVKKSLRSPLILADKVIVDPEFTLDLPLYITGTSGMDALVQLLESYVSKKAKPVPQALALSAFPVMLKALQTLPAQLSDAGARTGAAYGSLVSGIALANSGLGAVHGFASALGGLSDIPHGLVCAVLLAPVLRANREVIEQDLRHLLGDLLDRENNDPIDWLINKTSELLDLYSIPPHLKAFTIKEDMIPHIAEKAVGSSMSGNPRELSMEEKIEILSGVV